MCPKNKLEEYSSKIKYDLWLDVRSTDAIESVNQKKMEYMQSKQEFFQHLIAERDAERVERNKNKNKRPAWHSPYPLNNVKK